jgi:hypothetical protein
MPGLSRADFELAVLLGAASAAYAIIVMRGFRPG